jgi:hypothetical protein
MRGGEMPIDQIRQAVTDANINHDAEFAFDVVRGLNQQPRLIVRYIKGNEYLRLDRLMERLRQIGEVTIFEFRGRGRTERPSLIADMRIDGENIQLIYELP